MDRRCEPPGAPRSGGYHRRRPGHAGPDRDERLRRDPGRRRRRAGGIRRGAGGGGAAGGGGGGGGGNAGAARIEARSGVGEFILDFSGTPRGTTELEVHGGVGRVLLTVPFGLGVRVRASKGLTKSPRLRGVQAGGGDEG